jgi:hypothetical protein
MQAKHKNTGRWEGAKPCLSDSQVHLAAKKCGPEGGKELKATYIWQIATKWGR